MKEKVKLQARVNTEFANTLETKFHRWCDREGIEPSPKNLVVYLLNINVIGEDTAAKFMTLEWYPEALYKADCNKTKAIWELEEKVPYTERSIWAIIGNMPRRFSPEPKAFAEPLGK